MNNQEILEVIRDSFKNYLEVGTSRSTAKLKILHGGISKDIINRLGPGYSIQSQGYGNDKEGIIQGKYYPKNVDITVYSNKEPVAGYAVKFVMRNYSQNSNNYFENMLGETANIRANGIPYFQIFIIFDKVPYYKKGGELSRYDVFNEHNVSKYLALSNDDTDYALYAPNKTLLLVIALEDINPDFIVWNEKRYNQYYLERINNMSLLSYSKKITVNMGNSVILNDYDRFITSTIEIIRSKKQ